jgi:hypothetical protein
MRRIIPILLVALLAGAAVAQSPGWPPYYPHGRTVRVAQMGADTSGTWAMAPEQMYYWSSTGGDSLFVRHRIFGTTREVLQCYSMTETLLNNSFNLSNAWVGTSALENGTAGWVSANPIISQKDEVAPLYSLAIDALGEQNGIKLPVITKAGHGKDATDVGSVWSDGTYQYRIAATTASTITLYPIPWRIWTGLTWYMGGGSISVGSTLTHVRGAAHTGNITSFTKATVQQYPVVVMDTARTVLADGVTPITGGMSGSCAFIDVVQRYDIINPSTLDTTFSAASPFADGSVWAHNTNAFRISPGGLVVHNTFTVKDSMALLWYGALQAPKPVTYANYDSLVYYIPGVDTISSGGVTYDFSRRLVVNSNFAGFLSFTAAKMLNALVPVHRQVTLFKSAATPASNIGYAFGYVALADGSSAQRIANKGSGNVYWELSDIRKAYPRMVGNLHVTATPKTYESYWYRQWLDPTQYGDNKLAYWNTVGGYDWVYIDYHAAASADATVLPLSMWGKRITVMDSRTATCLDATVPSTGVRVTTSGASGFVVLRLEP